MIPRVKICCISSVSEALMAIAYGASAVGLVGPMPSGPGVISDELIAEIASKIPPPIASFLLTSKIRVNDIISHHRKTNTNTIQIVDELKEGSYASLRKALPAIRIVQVIHIFGEQSIEYALRISEEVDALLLDSGNPFLQVKELGGTGRIHNWNISRKIVDQSKVPVFLAGGLNASNVKEAIDKVRPFGLDICSGVRTAGQLDVRKLEEFFHQVQE